MKSSAIRYPCFGFVILLVLLHGSASAAQHTAYSMKVAQVRIKQVGDGWRDTEKDVLDLASVNQVDEFICDQATGDLTSAGEKKEGKAQITLDDLVVALRAKFRYNEWPLVSIDPALHTEKTQMQHNRFEGGIEDTTFRTAMYDADYRLKHMEETDSGTGAEEAGIRCLPPQVRVISVASRNVPVTCGEWCMSGWTPVALEPWNPRFLHKLARSAEEKRRSIK